jgi:Ca2+-binding EF-hand superfamily protein
MTVFPIRRLKVLLSGTCLLAPTLLAAQVTATGEYLARMDADQDGRIALAEYQAWMGYAFERMDANGDGLLTADELPGGRGRTVSLAEHRESLAAMFRRQDADRDGFLDAGELAAPPR